MSIKKLSDVTIDFSPSDMPKRLDITYLNPEKLLSIQRIQDLGEGVVSLTSILDEKPNTGKTPGTSDYVTRDRGVPILKAANLSDDYLIDWENLDFAPYSAYESSTKGHVEEDDILLLCSAHHSGYIGNNTSIVSELPFEQSLHVGELIRLRLNKDVVDPYYLTVLLNHELIKAQLRNLVRGVTIHLYPQDIGETVIFLPDRHVQSEIGEKLRESMRCSKRAAEILQQTESILSQYIQFPQDDSVITFDYQASSCSEFARLDPRFFDVKYSPFLGYTSERQDLFLSLSEIVSEPIRRGVQPEYYNEAQIDVLKTTNVNNRKVNWENCLKTKRSYFNDHPRGQIYNNDIVLTSTGEGSWGRAAICDIDRAFADGHLTILRIDENIIDPYSVLAFLWSDFGKMQFEQRVRGSTGQTEIYPQDIKEIKILKPKEADQKEIRANIQKQFELNEEAKLLKKEAEHRVDELLGDI